MSMVPLLFSDWWGENPHHIPDQEFGLGLHPEQLLHPSMLEHYMNPLRKFNPAIYHRPWSQFCKKGGDGTSTIKADKDQFQVILDVKQFKPEEIKVKVVDKCVIVEGKHEEKQDQHGWISRQFVRRYPIPAQCNLDDVASTLSSDGVLTITAPRKEALKTQQERTIKIEHTGMPAIEKAAEEKNQRKRNNFHLA